MMACPVVAVDVPVTYRFIKTQAVKEEPEEPETNVSDLKQCFGMEISESDTCQSRTGNSCYAKGPPMDPCVCRDGLVPRVLSYSELSLFGAFAFECCGSDAPFRGCEPPERHQQQVQVFKISAVLLLVFGSAGIVLTTWSLNAGKRRVPLEPGDCQVMRPNFQGDGWTLHQAVEPEKWCVSLQDLRQFRRLVMQAVSEGLIQPTERDMFDVADFVTGPSASYLAKS